MEFDFLNPDYKAVLNERSKRIKNLRTNPQILTRLKEHYKNNPIDFINDWGMTMDPRNAEIGLPVVIPFILFPRQEEYVDWLIDRWHGREDGLTEKSRDMGISWLCCAFAVWMWLFHKGTVIGFGSRKEEYVDKLGDPKSLFWKIREFIDFLPKEFIPDGYNRNKHALHMRIINPDNGAAIVGEAGDNIGRGNRTSIYFKDESAFYERQEGIDAALSQTSNCKIDVSTPNGNGNSFYRKRHEGKIPVFTFHWTQDPRKDEEWYEKQKNVLDASILAQEIDIDYNASVNNVWITGDIVENAQKLGPADIEAVGQWVIGVDAAHMGDDESVLHARKGRLNLKQRIYNKLDGRELADAVEAFAKDIEFNGERVCGIVIELDGPGVSCYDHLKRPSGEYRHRIQGLHTGARLKDNKNYNLKALLWRRARDYLTDGGVSLDRDNKFKSQLSSMPYKYKDGLLLMQKKAEYKVKFQKSPDRADGFVLTFADIDIDEDDQLEELMDFGAHNYLDDYRNDISGY